MAWNPYVDTEQLLFDVDGIGYLIGKLIRERERYGNRPDIGQRHGAGALEVRIDHAFNFCITAASLVDWAWETGRDQGRPAWQAQFPGPVENDAARLVYQRAVEARCSDLTAMREINNSVKHRSLRRGRLPPQTLVCEASAAVCSLEDVPEMYGTIFTIWLPIATVPEGGAIMVDKIETPRGRERAADVFDRVVHFWTVDVKAANLWPL